MSKAHPTVARAGAGPRAGPQPYANPFDVAAVYAATMRLALAMALVPGLGTGLLLVLVAGAGLPLSVRWPELAQVHGQVQALGFVVLFIVAVGLQLFPRFLGAPVLQPRRAVWGASLVVAALLLRWVAQPLGLGLVRQVALVVATVGVPIGVLLAGSTFHGLARRSVQPRTGPSAAWRAFIGVGGAALGGALIIYLGSGLPLVGGDFLVPQGIDEGLIHLELFGFATCLVLAVGSRVFGRFLLLRSERELDARLPLLALGWGLGLALVVAGWLLATASGGGPGGSASVHAGLAGLSAGLRWLGSVIEEVVLCGWLGLIGLYRAPSRPSGTPHVTDPTRRWIRIAFAFVVLALALNAGLFVREAMLGVAPASTELSAARHSLAQGFLLPMMVAMAARLLPIYSADVLKRRWLLELVMDTLFVGAAVRVGAELIGGYQVLAGPLTALGGTLGVVAFSVFAVGMWSALGRLPQTARST